LLIRFPDLIPTMVTKFSNRVFLSLLFTFHLQVAVSDDETAERSAIPIAEFSVSGIPFGADSDKVKSILGEPKPQPNFCKEGCIDIIDYPYEYEGIALVMHQDEAWRFTVTSEAHRLKSGIGIGSSIDQVFEHFGKVRAHDENGKSVITYRAVWPDGKVSRVFLDFFVVDGQVDSFVVTIR
jgi:hypothetical protein